MKVRAHIPSAVPEVEDQVSQELELSMLDIDCGSQSADILGHEVAEDDAPHGRFAGARLAHEEDLLLGRLELGGLHLDRWC